MTMLRLFQLELPLFRRAAPPAEQTRHIQLGTRIVDYRLIRSSRRTLGMTIDQRGLRVGASPRTSLADIERFLRHNSAWVLKKLDEWHGHGKVRHLAICDGALLPVLGEDCVVRIEPGANRVRWVGHTLILQARPDADLRQLARRALRTRALEVCTSGRRITLRNCSARCRAWRCPTRRRAGAAAARKPASACRGGLFMRRRGCSTTSWRTRWPTSSR